MNIKCRQAANPFFLLIISSKEKYEVDLIPHSSDATTGVYLSKFGFQGESFDLSTPAPFLLLFQAFAQFLLFLFLCYEAWY